MLGSFLIHGSKPSVFDQHINYFIFLLTLFRRSSFSFLPYWHIFLLLQDANVLQLYSVLTLNFNLLSANTDDAPKTKMEWKPAVSVRWMWEWPGRNNQQQFNCQQMAQKRSWILADFEPVAIQTAARHAFAHRELKCVYCAREENWVVFWFNLSSVSPRC